MLLISQCVSERPALSATLQTENVPSDAIPFEIQGPTTVQLPQKSLQLKIVLNSPRAASNLTYYWEVLEGGEVAAAEATYTEQILTLVNLKEGKMRWRAKVTGNDGSSHRDVAVTILPPKQPNRPPKVHINPSSPVLATEGDEVVLDAGGSSDEDGGPLDFDWKLLNGPVFLLPAINSAVLKLDSLTKGNYTFEVTVKDKQGATDSGTVNVLVAPKRDDPPKAQISDCSDLVPRSSIDVRLPVKTLSLCANTSTDDYGISTYKWFRVDNLTSQLAVDFTGSTTPVLSLANLQPNEKVGPYVFLLTVYDAKNQNDSAKISIMVNKAVNQVPIPYAGPNQTVSLSELLDQSVVLSGNVKDDGEIISYEWTQLKGPANVEFLNQDKIKCTAKGLVEGLYQFQLNVTDDGGLTAASDTFVNVLNTKNEPPIARARNVTVYLPSSLAVLNGSESTDDAGIMHYFWSPHDDVPVCINMLGESYEKPELLLAGLIPGQFLFDLTVSDHSDATNTTTVQLTVLVGEELQNSVEMFIESESNVTYRRREKLELSIEDAIRMKVDEADQVKVHFTDFSQEPRMGKLRAVFYVKYITKEASHAKARQVTESTVSGKVLSGEEVVSILRAEVNMLREFEIESIDTLFCTIDCSGHGICSNFSKQCTCDRYWMPNLFHYFVSGGVHDCSWSMLYFGIAVFMLGLLLPRLLCCLMYRRASAIAKWSDDKRAALRRRRRKRFRRNGDDTNLTVMNGNGKSNDQSSSYSLLMGSESLSSDTEIDQTKNGQPEVKKEVAPVAGTLPGTEVRERYSTISFDE